MLIVNINEDLRKWKDVPYLWAGRLKVIKMSTFPKPIYSIKEPLSKSHQIAFINTDEIILKSI